MAEGSGTVTELLQRWVGGDEGARDLLMARTYNELHAIAARQLAREKAGHTLQATALVHEAYLRLIDQRSVDWQNRAQFFAISARLIRRILIDHARAGSAAKRGAGAVTLAIDDVAEAVPADSRGTDVVLLDEALTRLEGLDAEQARVVELRYFGGLSIEETAMVVGTSPATVKREWAMARAWLRRELSDRGAAG